MYVGFGMNIICIAITILNTATLATGLFGLQQSPVWLNMTTTQ
jgi:hypothetical protein